MRFDFDVITIGGGIIGAAISDALAKRKLNVVILEKNLRIAQETSEGNSGVIHGGFDPIPGKLNAKLNLEGRKLYENDWFKNLDFPWKKVDSLILAFGKEEDPEIEKLYKRGIANGLNTTELSILTTKEIMALEPNVNPKVTSALLCTASYAVDPVLLTQSLVNRMLKNNGKLKVDHKVINIETLNSGFRVTCLNNEKK
ncbi:FAD-dependent oxidoreductase [Spiroplasma endosymbiont of Polydrusus pterygomalis]|uniref:FAD-dependent oxidoreductase n=1 Tax=Spiroplasma endosymbiont of Polydrusus pterygomalis TaxID=3139327 RepID=UPI003CCA9EF1